MLTNWQARSGCRGHDSDFTDSVVGCKMTEWLSLDFRQFPEFGYVNHALARFAFVQVRMRHSHLQRHVTLRQAGFEPSGDESCQDAVIVCAQFGIPALP